MTCVHVGLRLFPPGRIAHGVDQRYISHVAVLINQECSVHVLIFCKYVTVGGTN